MKRLFVTTSFGAVALSTLLLVPMQGCTDLSEAPPSQIVTSNFFRNQGEVLAALAGVYAQLRGTLDDYYNLSEISTDEMVVPTCGRFTTTSSWTCSGARHSRRRVRLSHGRGSPAIRCLSSSNRSCWPSGPICPSHETPPRTAGSRVAPWMPCSRTCTSTPGCSPKRALPQARSTRLPTIRAQESTWPVGRPPVRPPWTASTVC